MASIVSRPTFMEPSFVPAPRHALLDDEPIATAPPLAREYCEPHAAIDLNAPVSKLEMFNSIIGFFYIIPNIKKGVFSFAHYCEWEGRQETVKDTCEMMQEYTILNRDWWGAMCEHDEVANVERLWLFEKLLPTMSLFDIRLFVLPMYLSWKDLNPMKANRWQKMKAFIEAYKLTIDRF